MANAFFSIVVPAYNAENYISACIESVLNQTFKDWQLLIVNDGSTDRTETIIKHYAVLNKRISYISKENGGVSSARNAALCSANGQYLIFLDADDYLSNNALEIIKQYIKSDSTQLLLFGINLINTKKGTEVELNKNKKFINCENGVSLFSVLQLTPYACDKVYDLSIIKRFNIKFCEGVKIGEDLRFTLEYLAYTSKITFIPDVLYNYRWGIGVTSSIKKIAISFTDDDFHSALNAIVSLIDLYRRKIDSQRLPVFMGGLYYWNLFHRNNVLQSLIYMDRRRRKKIVSRIIKGDFSSIGPCMRLFIFMHYCPDFLRTQFNRLLYKIRFLLMSE